MQPVQVKLKHLVYAAEYCSNEVTKILLFDQGKQELSVDIKILITESNDNKENINVDGLLHKLVQIDEYNLARDLILTKAKIDNFKVFEADILDLIFIEQRKRTITYEFIKYLILRRAIPKLIHSMSAAEFDNQEVVKLLVSSVDKRGLPIIDINQEIEDSEIDQDVNNLISNDLLSSYYTDNVEMIEFLMENGLNFLHLLREEQKLKFLALANDKQAAHDNGIPMLLKTYCNLEKRFGNEYLDLVESVDLTIDLMKKALTIGSVNQELYEKLKTLMKIRQESSEFYIDMNVNEEQQFIKQSEKLIEWAKNMLFSYIGDHSTILKAKADESKIIYLEKVLLYFYKAIDALPSLQDKESRLYDLIVEAVDAINTYGEAQPCCTRGRATKILSLCVGMPGSTNTEDDSSMSMTSRLSASTVNYMFRDAIIKPLKTQDKFPFKGFLYDETTLKDVVQEEFARHQIILNDEFKYLTSREMQFALNYIYNILKEYQTIESDLFAQLFYYGTETNVFLNKGKIKQFNGTIDYFSIYKVQQTLTKGWNKNKNNIINSKDSARILYKEAIELEQIGQYKKAADKYIRASKEDPLYSNIYDSYGMMCLKEAKTRATDKNQAIASAISSFEKSIAIDNSLSELWNTWNILVSTALSFKEVCSQFIQNVRHHVPASNKFSEDSKLKVLRWVDLLEKVDIDLYKPASSPIVTDSLSKHNLWPDNTTINVELERILTDSILDVANNDIKTIGRILEDGL